MTTREDLKQWASESVNKNDVTVLEYGTGTGKTLCSLNAIVNSVYKDSKGLILVAETSHKVSWELEMKKHNIQLDYAMDCYASANKHISESYDWVIMDEIHINCFGPSTSIQLEQILAKTKKIIYLSGTIPDYVKKELYKRHRLLKQDVNWIKFSTSDAIDNNILPEPKIFVVDIPLSKDKQYVYTKIKGGKQAVKGPTIDCTYKEMFEKLKLLKSQKFYTLNISCTEKEYYEILSNEVDFAKKQSFAIKAQYAQIQWQRKAGQRKTFLGKIKLPVALDLLEQNKNYRTIWFCNSIEQADEIGNNVSDGIVIHSKTNVVPKKVITDYNSKKLNHIFAKGMFKSGVNLEDIQVGVFVQVDNSSVSLNQILGRVLRSTLPVLYVFRCVGTKDDEYVNTALEDINPKYIYYVGHYTNIINTGTSS